MLIGSLAGILNRIFRMTTLRRAGRRVARVLGRAGRVPHGGSVDIKRAIIDLAPAPIVKVFAAPYVAGKGIESGVRKADESWQGGRLHSTVDLLGEEVFKREDVEATVATYFGIIDQLAGRRYATISCKPT